MKLFVLLLITVSFIKVVYAQGEYLDRNNNAFGAGVSVGIHQNVYGMAASAAVSIRGTFDIGLSYAYLIAKANDTGLDPTSSVISPFINLHIIKQSDSFPVSLSAVGELQIQKFKSNFSNQTTSKGLWTYGASLFRSFDISEKYSLQPFITYTSTSSNDIYIKTISSTELSLAFISNLGNKKAIVHPAIAFSKNEKVYSIEFEFLGILSKR